MHPTLARLLRQGPVVTDGAWGTQLQARGLPIGACPDEWNLSHPEAVEAVARGYVEAGSRVILSNSFGANRMMLARHGLGEKTVEINRAAATLSKQAASDRALVFASIGPTGKMLMMEDCTQEEMFETFAEQATALADGGADGLVIETMADLAEAAIAVKAAKTTRLPVVATMVFDSGPQKDHTMMGATPEESTSELEAAGADVIGANCGQGIEGFIPICQRMRARTDRPLWMKANAGLPVMKDGTAVYEVTPAQFARHIPALLAAGADFVGGCCGTSPDFLRAVCGAVARAK